MCGTEQMTGTLNSYENDRTRDATTINTLTHRCDELQAELVDVHLNAKDSAEHATELQQVMRYEHM